MKLDDVNSILYISLNSVISRLNQVKMFYFIIIPCDHTYFD